MHGKKQVIAPRKRRGRATAFVLGAFVAGLVSYFFDPRQGRGRRAKAKDMTAARLRRRVRGARTVGLHAANRAQGFGARMQPKNTDYNDPTLQHKVESEILRHQDFPSGRVSVNAENGKIVLRGELDRPDQIRALEERVRRVPGVADVENLTHLRGAG
jgi:osmotically-inducible protein OsmY